MYERSEVHEPSVKACLVDHPQVLTQYKTQTTIQWSKPAWSKTTIDVEPILQMARLQAGVRRPTLYSCYRASAIVQSVTHGSSIRSKRKQLLASW